MIFSVLNFVVFAYKGNVTKWNPWFDFLKNRLYSFTNLPSFLLEFLEDKGAKNVENLCHIAGTYFDSLQMKMDDQIAIPDNKNEIFDMI